jgi:Major Facilitator Superfamily
MDHGGATISRAFSTRTTEAARQNTRAFWVVGATLFVAIMANNLPSPLYSVYRSEWHFSALTLTGVFAIAAAAVLPTLIAFGGVSNRAGRRPVLLLAILFIAASDLVFLGAAGVSWLYAGRILAGVGIGLVAGTAVAAMADFDVDHDHAARTGALATVSGQAVAPLAAGLLAQYAPMPTKLVFVLDLVVLIIIFGCLLRIPETVPGARWTDWRPQVVLGLPRPSRPAFALASLAAFGAFAVMGIVAALGPTFAAEVLHQTSRAAGGGVVFALLAVSAAAQLAGRRATARSCLLTGPLLLAGGLGLIILSKPAASIAIFVAGIGVAGGGQGLSYLGSQRLLDQHVGTAERAGAFAAFFIVLYAGTAAGALGVGLLTGPLPLFQAVASVALVVIVMAVATAAVSLRSKILNVPVAEAEAA